MSIKSGKSSKRIKQRDPSWKLRHALGHKVEPDKKRYIRRRKHPEEIEDPEADVG